MTLNNPALDWIISRPIAHRAYHDLSLGRAENSLRAFSAAISAGFAIECDLQLAKGGTPVVFHDPVLGRMTGVQGKVRDHTPEQLSQMRLKDTEDGIYTLAQHLELVDGQVPLILELKGKQGEDTNFVEAVADALKGYQGDVCVMSFDHRNCAQFQTLLPAIPRGLTAEGGVYHAEKHQKAMTDYDLQFVSYNVHDLPNKFVGQCRDAGLPIITWTVRNEADVATTRQYGDQITFEGFDPRELADGS